MPERSSVTKVVAALRRPGAEYELTQTIATFAQADEAFAASLALALIDAAPYDARGLRDSIPTTVRCTPERRLYDGPKDYGPVDLLFEGDDWALLVELKLYSPHGHTQLARYLKGGAALGVSDWGLLAVTRHEQAPSEEPDPNVPGWLGSIQWAALLEPFDQLRHADSNLEKLWRGLLEVETDNGDFGVINVDDHLVRGWAAWRAGRDQLSTLMLDLLEPTAAALAAHLPEGRDFERQEHPGSTGLLRHHDSIRGHFRVPADGEVRLWTQFYASPEGELYFTVEARMEYLDSLPPEAQRVYRELAVQLRDSHAFDFDDRRLVYIAHVHPADRWLRDDGAESAALLQRFIDSDVSHLVAAGAFDDRFDHPSGLGIGRAGIGA